MEFTNRELADIHFVYGFCNGNSTAAMREYRRRFPNRNIPNAITFTRLHVRIGDFGVRNAPRGNNLLIAVEDEEEILRLITNNPRLSTRRIALRVGIPHDSVWRILNREGLHAFHFRRVQEVCEPDYARRVVFCAWLARQVREMPNFLEKILWTDEASFTRAGITNHRNDHMWMAENPHAIRQSNFQHEFHINVWAGIIDNILIGPIVLPPRMNGARFLEFLTGEFFEVLENLPIAYRRGMILQLDGAPAHFARAVRAHLNDNFRQWIGRLGPIAWPPRSPDLTPLDYFLWGTMKQEVYFDVPNTREELLAKINVCAENLRNNQELIRRVTQQMGLRANACLQNNGGHFEQLLVHHG